MSTPRLKPIEARGAALAILLSILWGANPVAIKIGLDDADPRGRGRRARDGDRLTVDLVLASAAVAAGIGLTVRK